MLPSPYFLITFATISGAGIAEYLRPSSATQSPCFSINLFLNTSGDLFGSTGSGLGGNIVCFTPAGFTILEVADLIFPVFCNSSSANHGEANDDGIY